jgi:hypothetical protein
MANKIEIVISAVDQASNTFNSFRGRVDKLAKDVHRGFSSIMSIPNLIAGAAIVQMGKHFVKTAYDIEIFRAQLLAVSSTAKEADDALDYMREWARSSPLGTKDVIDSYVRLRAIGLSPTVEEMKTLGGVSLMFHKQMTETLDGFIGLNKRTLRQYGIDIDRTGSTAILVSGNIRKEVAKDSASIRKAVLEVWAERFPNALELAENTLSSKIEVMQSNIYEFQAQLTERFMPAIKDSVDGVSGSVENAQKHISTTVKVLAQIFRVLELGVRGIRTIISAIAMNMVWLGNKVFQFIIDVAQKPFEVMQDVILKIQGMLETLIMAKWVPTSAKKGLHDIYQGLTAVSNGAGSAIASLDKFAEFGDITFEEFRAGFVGDIESMEEAWIRWQAIINNAHKIRDLEKGKLPSTNPFAPEGDEDGKAGKAGKEYKYQDPESGYKYELDKAEAIAKNHFAKMEMIAVTADEKEKLRYQQELYDFINSSEAMYLSAEQFEERKTLLAQKHAALRKQIAEDETAAQWDLYSGLGQSLMDLGSEVTRASIKDAKKQRDTQITMAIVNAAAAAVMGVYKAIQDSKNTYEAVIKAVAVVASIAAVTIPQITRMQQASFATGTNYAPGGVARVHKDETIFLPRGSRVATARESAKQPVNISVSFGGGVTKETLPDIKKTLRNLGNQLKYGIRGGMIRPSQIGLAPA